MIKPALQFKKDPFWHLLPFSDEDRELLAEFEENQILESTLKGTKKERSLIQLRLYWSACNMVAIQLSDHTLTWSKEDVDFEVKTRVAQQNPSLIKRFKIVAGITYIEPISIAIVNLDHLDACRYFDMAFPVMGGLIDKTADELILMVKSR